MPRKTGQKREAPISYRPPAALREEFLARVENSGLPVSAFITKSIFDKDAPRTPRRSISDEKMAAKLTAYFGRLTDQLERIEAQGGEHGNTPLMQEAVATLAEIRSLLMQAAGRRS